VWEDKPELEMRVRAGFYTTSHTRTWWKKSNLWTCVWDGGAQYSTKFL
jgi:hypothetical protein